MRKYLFWGLLFIVIGTLWMLNITNIITFSFRDILSLWPLILIWIGIGILPLKDVYKVVLDILVLMVGVVLLISPVKTSANFCCKYAEKDGRENTIIESVAKVSEHNDNAKLHFNAGAAEIIFAVGDTALLDIVAQNSDNNSSVSLSREEDNDGVKLNVKILPKPYNVITGPYTVLLDSKPVWDMDIEVGASKNHLDLSPFKVEELKLGSGASDVYLKIGDLHPIANVELNMGVTNMEVAIPKSMNCHIKKESGITSTSFQGFTEKEKGHFFSAATDSIAKGTVNIEISSGVSNIVVTKY